MKLEQALRRLGKYSRWHLWIYCLISTSSAVPSAWHMMLVVFIVAEPPHHCALPANATKNDSIPYIFKDGEWQWSKCEMYTSPGSNETQECPNGWYYDPDYGTTAVTEWNLVCDNAVLAETSQSVFAVGLMVGAVLFCTLGDHFGRKPVFVLSHILLVVMGVAQALVQDYASFMVMRFFNGAVQQGVMLVPYVLGCEIFPANQREFAGQAIAVFWGLGWMFLALVAYLVRNWRHLQLAMTLPGTLAILLLWLIPESPLWLVDNDRSDEAEEIIKKAAKFNGIKIPYPILTEEGVEVNGTLATEEEKQKLAEIEEEKENLHRRHRKWKVTDLSFIYPPRFNITTQWRKCRDTEEEKRDNSEAKASIKDILRSPLLRKYTAITAITWFIDSLVYYGLSLSSGTLAGDRYVNFFLSGAVEVPACILCIFILRKWGRRLPLCFFHVVSCLSLIVVAIVPQTGDGDHVVPMVMAFAMIGKFCMTAGYVIVYLYTPEIYPTNVRNFGVGIMSFSARIGGVVAPYSVFVAKIIPWVPSAVFASLALFVALIILILPETLNRPLPQNVKEVESWTRKRVKAVDIGNGDAEDRTRLSKRLLKHDTDEKDDSKV